jgi:small subunit ribosomal protein S17
MAVKEKVGVVVSDKMQKTVVVAVESRTSHPKYGKIVVKTTKFKAHDEEDKIREGDRVKIRETRPLSRTKRWEVVQVLSSSSEA